MLRFLGLSSATKDVKSESSRSLPASWYRSPELHQLERRAIISRKWILVTHSLRFKQAGDFLSFVYADFPFFLVQDRDGNINGFHNVCRHRAYPVVEKQSGKASIISCKYHGWSYGYKGNLAKAPRFDTVKGFDQSQNGLLPIHVRVDQAGFVWVNLQAGDPEVKWEDEFGGVYQKPRMQNFDFAGGYTYDHVWDMELEANWKAVIENYNECYHCPTSHPLIAGVSDLTKYRVEPSGGCLEHEIVNKKAQDEEDEFRRSITYFYPSTSVTITQNFFYIQRMIPVSATRTRIENEVYRSHTATDAEFTAINAFYKQVLEEDRELCLGAQENLNAGVFISGELHPDKEKGPIHFQNTLREEVMAHRQKELNQGGKEIWPATPQLYGTTGKLGEDELFCAELEKAGCASRQELAW